MSAAFPKTTRVTMVVLNLTLTALSLALDVGLALMSWFGKVARTLLVLGMWGACFFVAIYILTLLNWAPLWFRLYGECMKTQREANTVTDVFQHRADCMGIAAQMIGRMR